VRGQGAGVRHLTCHETFRGAGIVRSAESEKNVGGEADARPA
jgi:hypothetical protein